MGTAQHHEARVSLLDGQPLNLPHYPQRAFSDDNRVLKKDRSMNNRYTNTGSAYGAPKTSGVPHQSFFRYHPSSLAQWAFLGLTLGQLVLCVALECYIFAIFNKEIKDSARDPTNLPTETKAITIFLTIFIFGFLYELLLVWDALRGRNTLQICGVCIYNLALMIYAAIQPDQIDKALQLLAASNLLDMPRDELFGKLKPFFVAIPIIIAAFSVAMAWVSWKLYREFAWVIYKQISADLRMKQRFLQYQIYIALLKFDFFFFLGFALQFIVLVLKTNDSEFGLSIAAVPFTIAFLFLAAVVTRRESIVGMVVVVVFYLAALAYYIFKLVRIYSPKVTIYSSVRKSLASFAVLAILLIVVTIAYAIICSTNFGKGLKPHIQKKHGAGKNQEPGVENGMGMGVMGGTNGMNGQGMHGNGFGGYGGYDPGYGEMGKVPGVTQSQTRMTID